MRRCGARSESRAQNAEPPSPAPTTTTSTGSNLVTVRRYAPDESQCVSSCSRGTASRPVDAVAALLTAAMIAAVQGGRRAKRNATVMTPGRTILVIFSAVVEGVGLRRSQLLHTAVRG